LVGRRNPLAVGRLIRVALADSAGGLSHRHRLVGRRREAGLEKFGGEPDQFGGVASVGGAGGGQLLQLGHRNLKGR